MQYYDDRDPGDEDPKAHSLSLSMRAFILDRIIKGLPPPTYSRLPVWHVSRIPGSTLCGRCETWLKPDETSCVRCGTQRFSNHDPGDEHYPSTEATFDKVLGNLIDRVARMLRIPREFLMPPRGSSMNYRWENGRLVITQLVMPHDINIKYDLPRVYFGHDEG